MAWMSATARSRDILRQMTARAPCAARSPAHVAGAGARLISAARSSSGRRFRSSERSRGSRPQSASRPVRAQPQDRCGKHNRPRVRSCRSFHQRAREPHEERRRLDARHQRCRGGVVEHDDIDVAGIMSSCAPILPMAAPHSRCPLPAGRRRAAAGDLPRGRAEEIADRRADGGVG